MPPRVADATDPTTMTTTRTRLVLAMLLSPATAAAAGALAPPPATKAAPVTDTVHGVELVYEFRWLEPLEK